MPFSNLELIKQVDSVDYSLSSSSVLHYQFLSHDSKTVLGYIIPEVAEKLSSYPDLLTIVKPKTTIGYVILDKSLDTFEKRTDSIAYILQDLRENDRFNALKGWRNELYTVYNPTRTPYFLIERAGSGLFGIVTQGVHITGYQPATDSSPLKVWVPRRSYSKPTYPGMLDNTIAGGIGHPHGIFETVLKESYEEAGLDEEFVKSNIEPAGVVSYFHQVNNQYLPTAQRASATESTYQPEVEYIYDIIIPDSVKLQPIDGEVAEFYLMDIESIKRELAKGSFKYNCALVMIDFFVRHGVLTAENEPDLLEITQRCHRRLDFPFK